MQDQKLDAVLVRSTDRHLNEYVPDDDSTRQWLTGFTGSMGEALVCRDRAYVAVDGRYHLQADQEVDASQFTVVKVSLGESVETALLRVLRESAPDKARVGYETARMSVSEVESIQKKTAEKSFTWVATYPSLVELARGEVSLASQPVRALDETKLDLTATHKVAKLASDLERLKLDALFVQTLDELAYLSNLRGSEIPYSATFRGVGLLTPKRLVLGCNVEQVPATVRQARLGAVEFTSEDAVWAQVKKGMRIGYDPRTTSARSRDRIAQSGAEAVSIESPVGPMKAKKGPRELKAMVAAFAKADKVVSQAADWLCSEVSKRNKVSELDFANKVEALFTASGATGLSFKVISAAGRNGATIHYSHPNPRRIIKQGELMLLDTGAYYDEGYATDLTRTFLVGPKSQKATKEQKYYFTLVLKSAVAGMRARIPVGTRGDQLDAITRAPLWYEGLNYNHGTGHGVGINVHEFPPRIAPQGTGILEEGMVFSIEPGCYLEKFGGVRIENLCTLERIKGMAGTLQVRPLTFSPLDQRLIDRKLLNEEERTWLAQYMRGKAPQ